jgi:hypothetical protein
MKGFRALVHRVLTLIPKLPPFKNRPVPGLRSWGWRGIIMPACGGGNGNSGGGTTAPGSYTLLVTGTFTSGADTLTHTTKLTLIVQ